MTKLPARPAFHVASENLRKAVAYQETELVTSLSTRPWVADELRGGQLLALDSAAMRAAIDPSDPAIRTDLERAACIGAALFAAMAAGTGTEIDAPLPGGGGVTTCGTAPSASLGDPIYWRNCLLAALAVRHARATEMLASVPLSVLRALAPKDPDWAWSEREALQSFALRRPDAGDRLVAAAQAADPAKASDTSHDWVLDVVSPELQLAFRAIARDQTGFDTWMVAGIKGHHHYYQSKADRKKLMLSQLALAPLAMACVAHDLGIRTNIESDYLPRHIIGV